MELVSNAVLIQGVTLKDIVRMVKRVVSQQLEEYKSKLPPPTPPQKAYIEKPPTTYIKRIEAAKLLSVNVSTIDDWTKAGFLRSYHIGGRVYYTHEDIEKAMGVEGSVDRRGRVVGKFICTDNHKEVNARRPLAEKKANTRK